MSMSIYAMSYSNGSMQNKENGTKSLTRTTDVEDVKVDTLQQGVGTARLTRENIRQDGTVSLVQRMQGTEAYRQIQAGETGQHFSGDEELTEEPSHAEAALIDRVEISEEGRIANAKMRQQTESIDTIQDTKGQLQEAASDDTEYEIEDLSKYTDAELEQMYYRGEITLQEYEDETGKVIE